MKKKSKIEVGDRVKFHSGNFSGLTGYITAVNFNSKHPGAIYGFLHTVKLSDGRIGFIEKGEYWHFLKKYKVMCKLIKKNYKSIVARGLITNETSFRDFAEKLFEEIEEFNDELKALSAEETATMLKILWNATNLKFLKSLLI